MESSVSHSGSPASASAPSRIDTHPSVVEAAEWVTFTLRWMWFILFIAAILGALCLILSIILSFAPANLFR